MSEVDVMEAIGYGPDSETIAPSVVALGDSDVHSNAVQRIRRNPEGLPVYSCERWIRLRFNTPGNLIGLVRFWSSNLEPQPGWTLLMGATDTYRKPTSGASDIAVMSVPVADPGPTAPNVYPLEVSNGGADQLKATFVQYSPWVVLQATWEATDDDPFQATGVALSFAWRVVSPFGVVRDGTGGLVITPGTGLTVVSDGSGGLTLTATDAVTSNNNGSLTIHA